MRQKLNKLFIYLCAFSKYQDLNFKSFEQLERKKTIRKDSQYV